MGDVLEGRDRRLDRIVAIKTLKGLHTGRFEQEARPIAALNHRVQADYGWEESAREFGIAMARKGVPPWVATFIRWNALRETALVAARGDDEPAGTVVIGLTKQSSDDVSWPALFSCNRRAARW
jgi:hypothetical protein